MADESSDVSTDPSESPSESESSPEKSPEKSPPKKLTIAKTMKNPISTDMKTLHPKTAEMVNEAIKELAERGGSSLVAIKKFISGRYGLDVEKQARWIKKYLKKAVDEGTLVQTKGHGASGSFKMPSATVLAAQRKKEKDAKKAESTEKIVTKKRSKKTVTAEATESEESVVPKKPSKKTVSAETIKAPRKKQTSAKNEEEAAVADKKSKTVKIAKKPAKSPSKTAKKTTKTSSKESVTSKSPNVKPKLGRTKKVTAVSPKPASKKTAAVKK